MINKQGFPFLVTPASMNISSAREDRNRGFWQKWGNSGGMLENTSRCKAIRDDVKRRFIWDFEFTNERDEAFR